MKRFRPCPKPSGLEFRTTGFDLCSPDDCFAGEGADLWLSTKAMPGESGQLSADALGGSAQYLIGAALGVSIMLTMYYSPIFPA